MKDTDFNIRYVEDADEIQMYLFEFGCMLDFDSDNVYVTQITKTDLDYADYEQDLSPILHWIQHMYSIDGMREVITNDNGINGHTKQFRKVYNQLSKQLNAYELKNVTVINETH